MLQYAEVDSIEVTDFLLKYKNVDEWRLAISELDLELSNDALDDVTPALGQTVLVKRGFASIEEDYVFRGQITQRKPVADKIVLVCKGQMIEALKAGRTKSWDKDIDIEAGVGSEIFKSICDNSSLSYTSASIPTTGTATAEKITKFIQNDEDDFQKMNELAEIYNNRVIRFDNENSLVFFEPPGTTTYTHVLVVGIDIPGQIKWKENMEQMINKVKIVGATVLDTINPAVFAGPATQFTLTKTPEDTEVRQTNASGALFTRGQKGIGVLGTDFDYYVDVEQKTINFASSKSNVWVKYGAQIPMPVVVKNQTSIDTYGGTGKTPHFKRFTFNDIKDVIDAENRGRALINKYSTPFIEARNVPIADDVLETHGFIKVGDLVTIQDDFANENNTVFVKIVEKTFPEPNDRITIGDEIWRTEDWQGRIMEKINLLFSELSKNQDILISTFDLDRTATLERRYIEMFKRDVSADFIWGNTNWAWGTVPALWDATYTASETSYKILQGNMEYDERFYDTIFKNAATTANWDTTNKELVFSNLAFTTIAYYKLNGDSTDSASGGNNGVDTDISYVSGKLNQAASFNGSTSKIEITDASEIQNIWDGGGTIAAWIFPDSDGESDTGRICDKTDVWVFFVREETSGDLKLAFFQNFSTTQGNWKTTSDDLIIGAWNHVAIVYNSDSVSNNPVLYVNGVSVGVTEAVTPVGTRTTDVGSNLAIGNPPNQNATFDGEIDNVRIYNTALTSDNIVSLYNSGTGTEDDFGSLGQGEVIHKNHKNIVSAKFTPTVSSLSLTVLTLSMRVDGVNWETTTSASLLTFANTGQELDWKIDSNIVLSGEVAHYKFDGDSTDSSTNSNDGTDTSISYVTGKLSNAASFDGVDSKIAVSDNTSIQNIWDSGGSIAVWIFPDSDGEGSEARIVDKGGTWLLQVREESASAMRIGFFINFTGSSSWETASTDITAGVWNHVVITYNSDSADNDPTIYVNGTLVTVNQTSTGTGSRPSDIGDDITVGNLANQTSTFDGEIDDLRIYDVILNVDEVAYLYNAGSGRAASGVSDVKVSNIKIAITEAS